jgi:hypothetical protein
MSGLPKSLRDLVPKFFTWENPGYTLTPIIDTWYDVEFTNPLPWKAGELMMLVTRQNNNENDDKDITVRMTIDGSTLTGVQAAAPDLTRYWMTPNRYTFQTLELYTSPTWAMVTALWPYREVTSVQVQVNSAPGTNQGVLFDVLRSGMK